MDDTNAESDSAAAGTAATLVNIFAAPREAFAALAARPTVLVPILALLTGNVALVLWYYGQVDAVWLLQTSLEAAGQEMPPNLPGGEPPAMMGTVMSASAAVFTVLRILIVLLVFAGYLSLVSQFRSDGVSFKRWLSLGAWSSMPTLLGVLSALANLAVNDAAHMAPTELNPLSFANLLGMEATGGRVMRTMLLSMDPTVVWALALMIRGYALWTRSSAAVSFAVVAGPLLALGGLAALLSVAL